jgi:hypothetical protein
LCDAPDGIVGGVAGLVALARGVMRESSSVLQVRLSQLLQCDLGQSSQSRLSDQQDCRLVDGIELADSRCVGRLFCSHCRNTASSRNGEAAKLGLWII